MDAASSRHPSRQELSSYGLGKLDAAASEVVRRHLDRCVDCREQVAELSDDSFLGRVRAARESGVTMSRGDGTAGLHGDGGSDSPGPPPVDTLPPELVDHADWEIIRELGRGGMGVVYLAKNELMGRMEVLKVVGRHLIERPGIFERFRREIQAAARLQHVNIVAAYTAVRLGSSLVFAMEYVEGLDLARMVKTKGPLPIGHAAYFVHQVSLGLQHAHERGMVHRDIKPANLILARDGKKAIVKVLDFGLARVSSEGQSNSNLTREGQMVGTPDFIAPEQIRDARSADIRADIYSLGCTLYYLLTGGPPFRGEHLWDVYQAHFSMQAAPVNLARPEVPVELAGIVAKMMAKEPNRRFQTPGHVAQALVPFFKTVASAARGTVTELAQSEQPTRQPSPIEAPIVRTQPATSPPPAAAPPAPASPRPQRAEPKWESLIEFKETEPLTEVAPRAAIIPKVPRQKALWVTAAACVLLLGLVCAWKGRAAIRLQRWPPLQGAGRTANVRIVGSFQEHYGHSAGRTGAVGGAAGGRNFAAPRARPRDGSKKPAIAGRDGFVQSPASPAAVPKTRQATPTDVKSDATRAVAGFVPLFNGKDIANWTAWSGGRQLTAAETAEMWQIGDGILHGVGGPSDLASLRADYKNFRLRAEVMINDGGNSGVFFRASLPNPALGYEAQVNSTHSDPNKTGSLYRVGTGLPPISVNPSPVPPDTWFTLGVEVIGARIRIWVKDTLQVDWTDAEKTYTQGHIAIQAHHPGSHVQIRKLEVMELDESGKPIEAGGEIEGVGPAHKNAGIANRKLSIRNGRRAAISGVADGVESREATGKSLRSNPSELTKLRLQNGMSRAVFAEVLNVSTKTVPSWEQGQRTPSKSALRLVQAFFREHPSELLNVVGISAPGAS